MRILLSYWALHFSITSVAEEKAAPPKTGYHQYFETWDKIDAMGKNESFSAPRLSLRSNPDNYMLPISSGGADANLLDYGFHFNVKLSGDNKLEIHNNNLNTLFATNDFTKVEPIYNDFFSVNGSASKKSGSFSEFIDSIKNQSASLSKSQKDMLLMMIGGTLGSTYYDYSLPGEPFDADKLFANLKSGKPAGICGDIHVGAMKPIIEALYGTAKNQVGTLADKWNQGKNNIGGHYTLFFQDPDTKKYRFLNYGRLVDIDTKDPIVASSVASQMLSPLSTNHLIEMAPGQVHSVQTPLAHVVKKNIDRYGKILPEGPRVEMELGNKERSVSAHYALGSLENGQRFTTHLGYYDYPSGEGNYQVAMFGARYQATASKELKDKVADELRFSTSTYAGYLHAVNPNQPYNNTGAKSGTTEQGTIYVGVDVDAAALRTLKSGGTMKADVNAELYTLDINPSGNIDGAMGSGKARAALSYQSADERLQANLQSHWELMADTMDRRKPEMAPRNTHNTAQILYEISEKDRQLYINPRFALMQGGASAVEASWGYYEQITDQVRAYLKGKARLPLSNPKDDPYYSEDPFFQATAGVSAPLSAVMNPAKKKGPSNSFLGRTRLNVDASYTSGRYLPELDDDLLPQSPDISDWNSDKDRLVIGAYLSGSF